MDKKRKLVQFFSTLLYNLNLKGLIDGELYRGGSKGFCVPGLNCYSCPAAVGSCPLGALQSTLGNVKRGVSTYVFGILIAFGVALGRVICGWLCPFGLLQELLYKIPTPKCRSSLKRLRWIKYFILAVLVCLIPLYTAFVNGVGFPAFCKYICPQGTIGGILLMTAQEELRELAGMNFWWKFILLLCFLSVSIWVFRPFCRVICPLGVIYGLFNGIALVHLEVDKGKCTGCGKCSAACPMALKPVTQCNHAECIRCGKCVQSCNERALHFRVKRGDNSRSNALQMMEKRIQSMRGRKE